MPSVPYRMTSPMSSAWAGSFVRTSRRFDLPARSPAVAGSGSGLWRHSRTLARAMDVSRGSVPFVSGAATHLSLSDGELARVVEVMPPARQRRVALNAARAAVEATSADDARVAAAAAGRYDAEDARADAEAVEEEFDSRAWALMDDEDKSDEYAMMFQRARAAAAVRFLFEPNPRTAAMEAIYEAGAAIGNYPPLD